MTSSNKTNASDKKSKKGKEKSVDDAVSVKLQESNTSVHSTAPTVDQVTKDLMEKIKKLESEIEQRRMALSVSRRVFNAKNAEIVSLKTDIETLKKDVQTVETEKETLQKENDGLKKEIETLNENFQKFQSKIVQGTAISSPEESATTTPVARIQRRSSFSAGGGVLASILFLTKTPGKSGK